MPQAKKNLFKGMIAWIIGAVVPLILAIVAIVVINSLAHLEQNIGPDVLPAVRNALIIPLFILMAINLVFVAFKVLNFLKVNKEIKARGL